MRKPRKAQSRFFDPIANWPEGIMLVRPYAYAEMVGIHASQVKEMCKRRELPHLFDGDTYLIPIDTRLSGRGGRFTPSRRHLNASLFPRWKTGR